MITIKALSGAVLYVAENATDVRQAVVEATKQGAYLRGAGLQGAYLQGAGLRGADLQGADLRGADLQGADLQGADLQGADLQGADLQGAYLQGADLQGADLQGADLQGADLQGADLQGADLQGAYLQGAYLQGAYLQGALWLEVAVALKTALQAMNDGGKHWIKGALESKLDDGSATYCAVGSVNAHSEGTVQALALWLLESAAGGSVEAFNDYAGTTWQDVEALFGVAIRNAERFGA